MNAEVELYDYDVLRRVSVPTMFEVRASAELVVLGSSQDESLLAPAVRNGGQWRRRRGGGGAVLLRPDDVWVDWWIPSSDPRWRQDIHESAMMAGGWWKAALAPALPEASVYDGRLVGGPASEVVCFAGLGPGELVLDGRKCVGITQWRVREGVLLSSVLPSGTSTALQTLLRDDLNLRAADLDHWYRPPEGLDDDLIVDTLADCSGPWHRRSLLLAV